MSDFRIHTVNSAPEASAETLGRAEATYGFVPNILGVMAEAPSLLKGYVTLSQLFGESSLSKQEQQVVLLAVSGFNRCDYCTAAHSVSALKAGLSEETIEAFRCEIPLDGARLETLRWFTTMVLRTAGMPGESHLRCFYEAGYTRAQVLEVILGIGLKLLSNTTNHIANPPLDAAFKRPSRSPAEAGPEA